MKLFDHANNIEKAALTVRHMSFVVHFANSVCFQTISEGKSITGDLGGKASTVEYTNTIVDKLRQA